MDDIAVATEHVGLELDARCQIALKQPPTLGDNGVGQLHWRAAQGHQIHWCAAQQPGDLAGHLVAPLGRHRLTGQHSEIVVALRRSTASSARPEQVRQQDVVLGREIDLELRYFVHTCALLPMLIQSLSQSILPPA
jgi:hypothetical protein